MHGSLEVRAAEDVAGDGDQFDYDTVTAVASGNPLLLERAAAQADLDKLARLAAAHERADGARRVAIRHADTTIPGLEDLLARLEVGIRAARPTSGDQFTAVIAGHTYPARGDAAAAVRRHLNEAAGALTGTGTQVVLPRVVQLGGHSIDATLTRSARGTIAAALRLHDLPEVGVNTTLNDLGESHGIITRLENLITNLPAVHASTTDRLTTTRRDLAEARAGLGQPFPRAGELRTAQERLQTIDDRLTPTPAASPGGPAVGPPAPARPAPGHPGPPPHQPSPRR